MLTCFPLSGAWSLEPKLIRRYLEEQIIALVPIEQSWMERDTLQFFEWSTRRKTIFKRMAGRGNDLELHIRRPEALRRFAHQRFGPGLEERFLASKGSRDLVIYSITVTS